METTVIFVLSFLILLLTDKSISAEKTLSFVNSIDPSIWITLGTLEHNDSISFPRGQYYPRKLVNNI